MGMLTFAASVFALFALVGFVLFLRTVARSRAFTHRDAYSFPSASLLVGFIATISTAFLLLLPFLLPRASIPTILLGAHSPLVLIGVCALLGACASLGFVFYAPRSFPSRRFVGASVRVMLFLSSTLAVATTVAIVASLLFETLRFLEEVPLGDFLFGLHWSPQTALFSDDIGSSGAFGAIPVVLGTFLITLIAISVAVPIGLFAAVYLSEFAHKRTRSIVKPILEILSGIPTVVYGFFAALVLAPLISKLGDLIGLQVASESALAAGMVMGVMLIPFVSSLSDDALAAVPRDIRDASLALGATQSETVARAVLPAAFPGVLAGVLLAFSRAVGETMIVVMAAGLAAKMTFKPLAAPTTITVQIVTLLVGDQEFDSSKTLSAFALGMLLFCLTLVINASALFATRRYGSRYE